VRSLIFHKSAHMKKCLCLTETEIEKKKSYCITHTQAVSMGYMVALPKSRAQSVKKCKMCALIIYLIFQN